MKKNNNEEKMHTCLVIGFRHSHTGVNIAPYIYIYIQVEFHLIQNLNSIGIKIYNQCVLLLSYKKKWNKKKVRTNRKKKETLIYVCYLIFFFFLLYPKNSLVNRYEQITDLGCWGFKKIK